MLKYTVSKKADRKIQYDLDIIKRIIIKRINPISIILFGGFGKGEGSFEIVKGKTLPLNDYDLYIIAKEKISDKILDEVGKECSKAIGRGGLEFVETPHEVYDKNRFFHVDLRCLTLNELKRLKKTNRTYELKHASTVIYGRDLRNKIKNFSLPISEAFRYLMNPACQLLVCMDSRRLKNRFKGDEKFLAGHYINKVYLSCASSLLISARRFSPTYTGTNKAFQKAYGKKFPKLARKVNEATKFKLSKPGTGKKEENIIKKWFEARDDLTFTLNYLANKHLNIKTNDIRELIKKIYKKLPYTYFTPYLPFPLAVAFPAQYFLNILYFIRTRYARALLSWRDVGIKIFLAAFLLLHASDDKITLKDANKYIRTFAEPKSQAWEDLRAALLYAFDKYFSQKLI
jgi:predicted nucleotidyltransferase